MSLIEGYRLFTGNYIYESDLPSEAKLEFIQFLKEASGDDIIDVLEGQYEGVEGLTEDEMEALNTFIEEKFGAAWAATKGFVGRQAGRVGQQAGKAGRGVKKGLGYEKVARAKAAQELVNTVPKLCSALLSTKKWQSSIQTLHVLFIDCAE